MLAVPFSQQTRTSARVAHLLRRYRTTLLHRRQTELPRTVLSTTTQARQRNRRRQRRLTKIAATPGLTCHSCCARCALVMGKSLSFRATVVTIVTCQQYKQSSNRNTVSNFTL